MTFIIIIIIVDRTLSAIAFAAGLTLDVVGLFGNWVILGAAAIAWVVTGFAHWSWWAWEFC